MNKTTDGKRARSRSSTVTFDKGLRGANATFPQVHINHDSLQFQSLTEYVIATLKETILSHVLQPGTRLTEQALARDLGVSRIPVREALKSLAAQGLVVLRPHGRGAAVVEPTQEMVRDIYQVRAALELLSTELATEKLTDEELELLEANVEDGFRAAEAGDWHKVSVLGSEFHRIIARGSCNAHLIELIDGYDEKLRWAHEPVAMDRGRFLWEEHRAIFDALKRRDKQAAVNWMREHTQRSGASLSQCGRSAIDETEVQPFGLLGCI